MQSEELTDRLAAWGKAFIDWQAGSRMADRPKYRKLRIVADAEQFAHSHICDAETGEPIDGVRGISFVGHCLSEEGECPYVTITLSAFDVEFVVANSRGPAPGNLQATIDGHAWRLPITAESAELSL